MCPRKAPTQVIEHRISLSDFERKELRELLTSNRINQNINSAAKVLGSTGGIGIALAALVYVSFSLEDIINATKAFVDNSSDKVKGWMESKGYINYQADEIGRQIFTIRTETDALEKELLILINQTGPISESQNIRIQFIRRRLPILSKRDDILREMLNDIVTGKRRGYTAYGGERSESLHTEALQAFYEEYGGTDEVDWDLDTGTDQ